MKIKIYLHITSLKIFCLIGLFFIQNTTSFAQENIENAKISLSFNDKSDVKTITAKVTNSAGLPIEELDLYFYVKRTFSLLPIGDDFNTTDENGIVEIEFPNDLPGDLKGNITLVVKIIESDIYKDLKLEQVLNWGIPITLDHSMDKRSLWAASANAPISLVVSVSLMIIVIWYIIFYIILKLYSISKIKALVS